MVAVDSLQKVQIPGSGIRKPPLSRSMSASKEAATAATSSGCGACAVAVLMQCCGFYRMTTAFQRCTSGNLMAWLMQFMQQNRHYRRTSEDELAWAQAANSSAETTLACSAICNLTHASEAEYKERTPSLFVSALVNSSCKCAWQAGALQELQAQQLISISFHQTPPLTA